MSKMENARTPEDCKTGYKAENRLVKTENRSGNRLISFETQSDAFLIF